MCRWRNGLPINVSRFEFGNTFFRRILRLSHRGGSFFRIRHFLRSPASENHEQSSCKISTNRSKRQHPVFKFHHVYTSHSTARCCREKRTPFPPQSDVWNNRKLESTNERQEIECHACANKNTPAFSEYPTAPKVSLFGVNTPSLGFPTFARSASGGRGCETGERRMRTRDSPMEQVNEPDFSGMEDSGSFWRVAVFCY